MDTIFIHTSEISYGKNYKGFRLATMLYDEKHQGGGTRICGPKFGDFNSTKEIEVPLTIKEAKTLITELQKLIQWEESNGTI